jgi:hypothetical protein
MGKRPVIKMTLHCSPHMSVGDTNFTVVSGGAGSEAAAAQPTTLHTSLLNLPSRFRLYRQRRGVGKDNDGRDGPANAQWDECGGDDNPGYMIVDDPPVLVNVSQRKDFAGLRPGEWWELRHLAVIGASPARWSEIFGDSAAGDR